MCRSLSFTPKKKKTKVCPKLNAKMGHHFLLELQVVVEAVKLFILANYFLNFVVGKGTQDLCGEKQLLPWKVV